MSKNNTVLIDSVSQSNTQTNKFSWCVILFYFLCCNYFRACLIICRHTVEPSHNRCHLKLLNSLLFVNRSLFLSPVCLSAVGVTGQLTFVCAAQGSFFSLLVKSWTCLPACQVLLLDSRSYFTLVSRIHWSHASFCVHLSALLFVHLVFVEG